MDMSRLTLSQLKDNALNKEGDRFILLATEFGYVSLPLRFFGTPALINNTQLIYSAVAGTFWIGF